MGLPIRSVASAIRKAQELPANFYEALLIRAALGGRRKTADLIRAARMSRRRRKAALAAVYA